MPTGPLAPYGPPLTEADARHLVRRTGFGAPRARVLPLVGQTAADAARLLLDEAAASPAPATPAWYAPTATDVNLLYAETDNVVRRMVTDPVREKLTLFWHNHLAAELRVYNNPAWGWLYYTLLRGRALGNVRALVGEIGKAPAMLRYLNGNQNTRSAPNQNYGRELLELFTMGQYAPDGTLNYTETDVVEGARALTGWRIRNGTEVYFTASLFDPGTKTFLGQTGAWGYDDVVRIVFEQRGPLVARFVARKLLAFYVAHRPDPAAEAALADVLVANGFELRPALDALFASEHFYTPGLRGGLVKAPTDLYVGTAAQLGVAAGALNATYVRDRTRERDEYLFNPPDVAGWDGRNPPSATGRAGFAAWYESDDFGPVWSVLRAIVRNEGSPPRFPADLLALAAGAPDPADPFRVALYLAECLIPVPLTVASVPALDDPFAGNQAIPPPAHTAGAPRHVFDLTKILLGGTVPHYEWAALPDTTRATRLKEYLTFLTTELPEYLLF